MKRGRHAGVILALLVAGAILACAAVAIAETITWQPSTGYTDDSGATGTFTPAEMATMKYYLLARKVGDANDRKYFGEKVSGATTWAGDLAGAFSQYGLAAPAPGETWEFTVSASFTNPSGVEKVSAESAVGLYTFPFAAPDRTPGSPGAPAVSN